MGNHSIGRAFAAIVETALERRRPDESALDILDMAAEKTDIRGADAEFDDARNTDQPLGKLIFEAFAPNGIADIPLYDRLNAGDELNADDVSFDELYDATYGAFRKRYDLC